MPRYLRCVDEDSWLSNSRSEFTWRAAKELASELMPEAKELIERMGKKRIATREEVQAWLSIFFKAKDYKPNSMGINLSRFYNPVGGFDTKAIAKTLGIKTEEAAVLVKKLDKTLMLAAFEEILQAVKHSYEHGHRIELAKKR